MEREQAYPSRGVDGILMRVMPGFCDLVGNIMDRDDPVEQYHYDEDQQAECKIVQCRIFHRPLPPPNNRL
jgi:hypothetical protein